MSKKKWGSITYKKLLTSVPHENALNFSLQFLNLFGVAFHVNLSENPRDYFKEGLHHMFYRVVCSVP